MHRAAFLAGALLLGPAAAAQGALKPHDVAVVTTDGLWLLRPPAPATLLLPASAFGGLVAPAIEWRPGTDQLLVASGGKLHAVTVAGPTPVASLADITPAGFGSFDFKDLDVHPDTGELFLLDGGGPMLLRFAPPFAAGMSPDLVVPLTAPPRALAVESAVWPPSVAVAYSGVVQRQLLGGAAETLSFSGAGGLDVSLQQPDVRLGVVPASDLVRVYATPQLAVEINLLWNLCAPVALQPVDVEFDAEDEHALVLAQDGVSGCLPGIFGANHVVSLPLGQAAGVPPKVLTGTFSGITGTEGDLAWVRPDLAHASPYGSASGAAPTLVLTAQSDPFPGNPGLALDLKGGPASAPAFLLAGVSPLDLALPSGQAVLVVSTQVVALGALKPSGKLSVGFALPAALPVGVDVFVQAAATGPLALSNGLRLHVAAP